MLAPSSPRLRSAVSVALKQRIVARARERQQSTTLSSMGYQCSRATSWIHWTFESITWEGMYVSSTAGFSYPHFRSSSVCFALAQWPFPTSCTSRFIYYLAASLRSVNTNIFGGTDLTKLRIAKLCTWCFDLTRSQGLTTHARCDLIKNKDFDMRRFSSARGCVGVAKTLDLELYW